MKLLFILTLAAVTAHARLGETAEQLTARYGPVTKSGELLSYTFSGFTVIVTMLDGRSACEQYIHVEQRAFRAKEITDTEAEAFMSANVPGGKWERILSPEGSAWLTEDKAFMAIRKLNAAPQFIIFTREFQRHTSAKKRAEEKAATKGF